jgi:4-diphosphocytidyl-2-C-methyl-D-erythritol kinase
MNTKRQIEELPGGLLVRAPAKINLSLLVAGKRPDGYHEIETVMAKVNWYDEISIRKKSKAGVELDCKGPYWAPDGEDNLVFRACATLLKDRRGGGVSVTLTKNVPAGAGLGSASSDAAAAIIGLNRLLRLGLTPEAMKGQARGLGSDVAFFLGGPLAVCTSRGEIVRGLETEFDFLALLVLPGVNVSTREVYAHYRADAAVSFPQVSAEINRHIMGNRIDLVAAMCANMLEKSCFGRYKELGELKAAIESMGIAPVCLSGSGSAMYCLAEKGDLAKVKKYQASVERTTGCRTILVGSNRW